MSDDRQKKSDRPRGASSSQRGGSSRDSGAARGKDAASSRGGRGRGGKSYPSSSPARSSSGSRPETGARGPARPTAAPGSLPRGIAEEVRASAKGPRGDAALAHLERAVGEVERGQPGKGIADAEQAKRLAPRAAAIREVLGLALYGAGQYQKAVQEFQAYRRLSGRTDQNHVEADCYRALGQGQKALVLVREELDDHSVDAEARAEAAVVGGSILAEQGQTDAALALLRRFKTRDDIGRPWDLRIWYVTGDILFGVGRREEAVVYFERVMRFDADAFDVAERLAAL